MAMSEKTEKMFAIGVGLLLVGGIVAWKSMSPPAVDANANAPQGQGGAQTGLVANVLNEREAPESYKSELFFRLKSADGLAAEKLAEIELRDSRAELEKLIASGDDSSPVRRKQMRLGANASLLGPVEDADGGGARVVAALYLVHAGKFPAAQVSKKHQPVCLVTDVDPSGDAHAGGLQVGDIWAQVGAVDVLASKPTDPCKELSEASRQTAVGSDISFVVYRAGQRTELKVHKGSDRLKFNSSTVPVLDADKTGT
jgi:hypothetical protein